MVFKNWDGGTDQIDLAQVRALLKAVMNFQVP